MSGSRVLVVGTTSDYIDIILQRFPGRAVFLTDGAERARAAEPTPAGEDEARCDVRDTPGALDVVRKHTARWHLDLRGIVCFDCESMALAAELADALGLCYPSAEAIAACRSKFESKQLWQRAGVPCPRSQLVRHETEAARFWREIGEPVVLKPLSGSGSELTFLCSDAESCSAAYETARSRLEGHQNERMYASPVGKQTDPDPRRVLAAEEFVQGSEYSCDFVLDADRVSVIRTAMKIPAAERSFGTTWAYVVPGELPAEVDQEELRDQLRLAAQALGLQRALCMVDMIVRDGKALLLEMTPRPGGDCLPPLLLRSAGIDILGCALDFAEGLDIRPPASGQWRRLVGLRLFADQAGVVRGIDTETLSEDDRVLECSLKYGPGHQVVLPPDDYDSRILGHVIFEPSADGDVVRECGHLAAKVLIEMGEPL